MHARMRTMTLVCILLALGACDQHHHVAPLPPGVTPAPESPHVVLQMEAGMKKMMHDMHASGYTGNPDVDFLAMMIPHHEGAVEMARLVLIPFRNCSRAPQCDTCPDRPGQRRGHAVQPNHQRMGARPGCRSDGTARRQGAGARAYPSVASGATQRQNGSTRSPKSLSACMIFACAGPPEWAWRSRRRK